MKIKKKLLLRFLEKNKMTTADLARAMGVSVIEIERMLDGKAVGVNTARKFIRYFSAYEAQRLIDWDAIGKKNPLAEDYVNKTVDDEDDEDSHGDADNEEFDEEDADDDFIEGVDDEDEITEDYEDGNDGLDDEDDEDGDTDLDGGYDEDIDEDAAEREYRRLNYDARIGVEELIDLEDRYRQ